MTRQNDANESDESTPNDEPPKFGRECGSCGGYYLVVSVRGPNGEARRGCGCPVTVVATDEQDSSSEAAGVVSA